MSIYPKQLQNMNLKPVFVKYASIQNKLLIDYKRVIKAIQIVCQQNERKEINLELDKINEDKI